MLKVEKKVIDTLSKCYAVAPLVYNGTEYLLVAAEKQDACNLYRLDGTKESVVWTEPGGTMSMVALPCSNGGFLATHRFYSPNDSEQASIVSVKPLVATDGTIYAEHSELQSSGIQWHISTLLHLPFLHRFDILERNGYRWLIMCTIKSNHRYKEDWSSAGKVYACLLPDDPEAEKTGGHALNIRIIQDGLIKNHGYTRDMHNGIWTAIISAENGVFRLTPPKQPDGVWSTEQLLDTPASDAVFADLKGNGTKVLLVISPFHGDSLTVYEEYGGTYRKAYCYPEPAEFSHAIETGVVAGKTYIFIGHRKGKKRLLAFHYDADTQAYTADTLDENAGAANAYFFTRQDGTAVLAVTNREIDEIALYTFLS